MSPRFSAGLLSSVSASEVVTKYSPETHAYVSKPWAVIVSLVKVGPWVGQEGFTSPAWEPQGCISQGWNPWEEARPQ